jgi:hypothetical protein
VFLALNGVADAGIVANYLRARFDAPKADHR